MGRVVATVRSGWDGGLRGRRRRAEHSPINASTRELSASWALSKVSEGARVGPQGSELTPPLLSSLKFLLDAGDQYLA